MVKKKSPPNRDFDYSGRLAVEKCMEIAGEEARKHSMGPKKEN